MGTSNDDRESGTICSANIGIGNQANFRSITYDISIRETTKGT
jgi:hypothetical protein